MATEPATPSLIIVCRLCAEMFNGIDCKDHETCPACGCSWADPIEERDPYYSELHLRRYCEMVGVEGPLIGKDGRILTSRGVNEILEDSENAALLVAGAEGYSQGLKDGHADASTPRLKLVGDRPPAPVYARPPKQALIALRQGDPLLTRIVRSAFWMGAAAGIAGTTIVFLVARLAGVW